MDIQSIAKMIDDEKFFGRDAPTGPQFMKLYQDAKFPTKGTPCSAGWDLYAYEDVVWRYSQLPMTFKGNKVRVVPVRTGIAVQLPPGTYGRLALRSGVSFREGFGAAAGVIDRDYEGEVIVGIIDHPDPEDRERVIKKGERVAQIIIERICEEPAQYIEYGGKFAYTYGKHEGFGSTGS